MQRRFRALIAAGLAAVIALVVGLTVLRLLSPGAPAPQAGAPVGGGPTAELAEGWTELPMPPEVRDGAARVWTGTELLAWGGCAPDVEDDCKPTADGYAFDPARRAWHALPEAPVASSGADGTWTGEEAIFLRFRDGRRLDGAAYDPATDAWYRIGAAPIRAEYGTAEVWTGSELVVFGGGERHERSTANGAAYDPKTDAWRRIAEAPIGLNASSGMWTGREVLVFGSLLDNRNHAATTTSVGAAYDPDRDRWRELPPSALSPQATSAVWVGDRMVAWDYEVHSQEYDPTRDEWTSPVRMPLDFSECYPASVPVRDFVFAFFCGRIALYDSEPGMWSEIHGGLIDEEIWSKAYERYLKVWRFADLVSTGDVVFLSAQGLTLNAKGVACYGCAGAEESFWAYRPPETPSDRPAAVPVTEASAYWVADEFMLARTLGAEGRVQRLVVRAAAAKFESPDGVPEPLLAGTWYSVHRPTAIAGQPGSFEVDVELFLKGRIGRALGQDRIRETLVIGPGQTMTGSDASLAVLDVRLD
ncbi:MAG TPA: hypothetical protein VGR41_04355 [Actinomycetota bacterium]|nr:hypothetical protein [Actinomycetota bacterium]